MFSYWRPFRGYENEICATQDLHMNQKKWKYFSRAWKSMFSYNKKKKRKKNWFWSVCVFSNFLTVLAVFSYWRTFWSYENELFLSTSRPNSATKVNTFFHGHKKNLFTEKNKKKVRTFFWSVCDFSQFFFRSYENGPYPQFFTRGGGSTSNTQPRWTFILRENCSLAAGQSH